MKKDNKQTTVNQHYLPQFYMRNFSKMITKKKKKRIAMVSFYQFKDEILSMGSTASICFEKFFYDEDNQVEDYLGQKEGVWGDSIKRVIENDNCILDNKDKRLLKEFAVFQYCRTLMARDYARDYFKELLFNIEKIKDEETINDKTTQEIDGISKEICAADLLKGCKQLTTDINDLKVSIVTVHGEIPLITSDAPIIIINPFCSHSSGFGLAMIGIVLMFPISDHKLIIIYDGKLYTDIDEQLNVSNEVDIININKYQIISANQRLISGGKDDFSRYYQDFELIENRQKYKYKQKTIRADNAEKGSIVHISARGLKMDYPINFFKLSKKIKRIPMDFRESFARCYDSKEYENVLLDKYILPSLIKKNKNILDKYANAYKTDNPKYLVKLINNAKTDLQKFLEDYWELSCNEQTKRTQNVFNRMRNVKTQFFACNKKL